MHNCNIAHRKVAWEKNARQKAQMTEVKIAISYRKQTLSSNLICIIAHCL